MAKDTERVQDWRKAKLQAGYELTTIWLRRADKRYLEDLARTRHQSLSDCLLDGLRALQPSPRTDKAPMLVDQKQLEDMVSREVAKLMNKTTKSSGKNQTSESQVSLCGKGLHPKSYSGECRECKKLRNQRSSKQKRTQQAGEGLMDALESTNQE